MPVPRFCRNPHCPNHVDPPARWFVHFGSYRTHAHGVVRRYRCTHCGSTSSDQSESVHYFAKRRLPLKAIAACLNTGTSLRDIGRRYRVSCAAVRNGVLRLGRQAMAAQVQLLDTMQPRSTVVFDGLRSFITAQDYPCDITTVVDRESETILTMTHSIFTRGGTMTAGQRRRLLRKLRVWRPTRGMMKRDIRILVGELWDYLRPSGVTPSVVDTDEHPLYRAALSVDPVWRHYRRGAVCRHRTTPGSAPRTRNNPLFPVNYVDRLLRHRVKEHTRETIAFGRHAVVQMHRAWIFAWDHNLRREYRVKRRDWGTHAEQGLIDRGGVRALTREFFERRIRLHGVAVPRTIQAVWRGELATPPVRWRGGQRGTMVRIPGFACADLAAGRCVPAGLPGVP